MTNLQNIFKNENKELALLNYIQKYWIDNRGISCFNYYDFINEFKINNNLNFLFITNNIIESFHQKMNMYLPKGKTTEKSFILAMVNIFKDIELMKNELKRHDFKTRDLITIATKFNKENKFKWFNYNEFKDIEISIIKKDINITDNKEINKNVSNLNNIYEIDETDDLNKLNINITQEEYDEYYS